ncbi:MAG: T9SS type A sorting domain-containing protein [Bacteroidaceae bacterium]|nr:T9SS type A sorting domain-containing protein [Bacteroidaceae bacterium]
MKKILFIISFISVAATATAQYLIIEKPGYENEVLQFEDLKQITFSGTTVNIEQNDGKISNASMGDISRIYISDNSSIADIEQQEGNLVEYLSFDEIAINADAGSMATIYNLTGALIMRKQINSQGEPISIATLPKGIYIVKANEKTTKIIKR